MIYHMTALLCGFIIDLIIGDPYCIPHPIRWIGNYISFIEKGHRDAIDKKYDSERDISKKLRMKGMCLVMTVCLTTVLISALILGTAYYFNRIAGCVIEAIMSWQILAARSLKTESMKVYKALTEYDSECAYEEKLIKARRAVSMIVGRDTDVLDEAGIIKATVETVAENTSDGVIAPMIYLAIGGPVLGFLYKSINTMDSMVGYKNDKYIDYGRYAARLDDIVNYIPARISAFLMIFVTLVSGRDFNTKSAYRIYVRDRYNHASPNSAQTESVCAGALGLQLAGDASYFGKIVKKPYIGDKTREIEDKDIIRANRLMYGTAVVNLILCLAIMGLIYYAWWRCI